MSVPLVSCICPTRNRLPFLQKAVRYFLAQDWPNRELLILDDSDDTSKVFVQLPEDPRIRYMTLSARATVGEKRNILCESAAGEIICHWDDDDWYGPNRITAQITALALTIPDESELGYRPFRPLGACVSGYSRVLFADDKLRRCWLYDGIPECCIVGTTLIYHRDYAMQNPFRCVDADEDNQFVTSTPPYLRYVPVVMSANIVARIHEGNTCQRPLALFDNSPWLERPWSEVEAIGYEPFHVG